MRHPYLFLTPAVATRVPSLVAARCCNYNK